MMSLGVFAGHAIQKVFGSICSLRRLQRQDDNRNPGAAPPIWQRPDGIVQPVLSSDDVPSPPVKSTSPATIKEVRRAARRWLSAAAATMASCTGEKDTGPPVCAVIRDH